MPYVMMPVPEEHVEEVMQFVLRAMAKASIVAWDSESISKVFDDVDEASRSLLSFVARAALEGDDLGESDAARKIQLTVRETAGIMTELNARTKELNRPNLIGRATLTERLPNGRMTDKRVLQMEPEVAGLVRAAEQTELLSVPHPLGEGNG